jgi:hypothetical protein
MAELAHTTFNKILAILKGDDFASVPIGPDAFALVDIEDVPLVSGYNWKTNGRYVSARTSDGGHILMHRLIMGLGKGDSFVDHEDGDGLNNRRYNLRLATHAQNMRNRNKTTGASKFKGVRWCQNKWRAAITADGNRHYLGAYHREVNAAKAYDRAAVKLHGEFAKTNKQMGLY